MFRLWVAFASSWSTLGRMIRLIVASLVGLLAASTGMGAEQQGVEVLKIRQTWSRESAGERWHREAAAMGRRLFMDTSLSRPQGQGCITCHQPEHAFADPRRVSPGAVPGRGGRRNAPTLMYAALIPGMAFDDFFNEEGEEVWAWEGGLFLDGRARDQFEQVQSPFFDPDEMNLPGPAALAEGVRRSGYADAFRAWVGDDAAWADDEALNYHVYRALVAFLKEPHFRPFDARIDDYLAGDEDALDASEKRGLEVFRNAGKCASCHLLEAKHWPEPLLSDFGYDNLGVPSSPGGKGKDPGLGAHTGNSEEMGQFKAPTLRNIALTAPYMHNGSIGTLQEVMEFYNKRDLEPERWGATDYPETVNRDDMGDLGLSDEEVNDLVALMEAFTDRSLLEWRQSKGDDGDSLPSAPPDVPSAFEMRLRFPDWTHRLHASHGGATVE